MPKEKWGEELPRVQEHRKERTELLWEGLGRAEYLLPFLNFKLAQKFAV